MEGCEIIFEAFLKVIGVNFHWFGKQVLKAAIVDLASLADLFFPFPLHGPQPFLLIFPEEPNLLIFQTVHLFGDKLPIELLLLFLFHDSGEESLPEFVIVLELLFLFVVDALELVEDAGGEGVASALLH